MLRMKNSFNLANGIILLVALCEFVGGNECTQKTAVGLPDVNMCETGTHVITGAYLSASSDQMGGGTRCTCTLVALSPQSNGSWCALNQPPRISSCSAFVTLQGSSRAQYTCQSSAVNTHVTMNASDIIIEVFRNGSADFGFCVIMTNSNYNQNNKYNLTCESDAFFNGTTTSPATGETTMAHTSTLTSSSSPTSSSDMAASSDSSTSSSPTLTTQISTVQTSTLLPTSISTSASSTSPYVTTTSSTTTTVSLVQSTVTEEETTTSSGNSEETSHVFPIIPVAAGVAGGLVFLIVVIIIFVVVCVRHKRRAKEKTLPRKPEVNRSYLRFSEVVLEDNILYESSSAFPAGDAPKTGSATQPVEDKTGGSPTSGKTSVQPGRGQYLGPAGDLYSLVQKPREDGGPEDASSAQRHSTAVDASPADEEDDEDDPALRPNMAANGSLSDEQDMKSGSPQSFSPKSGLHYVDMELALDHGGKAVNISAGDDSPTAEYTVIDHEATKNMRTAL